MSTTAGNQKMQQEFNKRLVAKIKKMEDIELIAIFADAAAFREMRRVALLKISSDAQRETIDKLGKTKKPEEKEG